MNNQWMAAVAVAGISAGTIGCGNELRNALEDIIDEREAGAAAEKEVFGDFRDALDEELASTWSAEESCPGIGPQPRMRPGSGIITPAEDIERAEYAETLLAWRAERVRELECECMMLTSERATNEMAELQAARFDRERALLEELTNEELAGYAPISRARRNQFNAELAIERVTKWHERRDGTEDRPGWGSGEPGTFFDFCDRF